MKEQRRYDDNPCRPRHFKPPPCAPVALNIVCFSLKSSADGEANQRIVMDLHDSGAAAPSITILNGKPVIRCAIVNHRTTMRDIDTFMDALAQVAGRIG